MNIAVLISGGGSTLENLCDRIADGRLSNIHISLVISSRKRVRGVEIANRHDLLVQIIYPELPDFSEMIVQALDVSQVDLVVMAGFLHLWKIPDRYEGRVLNIHPALLPKYGGKGMYGHHVHEAVLSAGETQSGCTVHFADNEYDHGSILAQTAVFVLVGDTPDSLGQRVMMAERELYPQVLQQIADSDLCAFHI
jgi:formyltetrahydrofolate-dependent phosphoribosylglycinamide formyltransferase